jgi:hypothetical protein
VCAPSLLQLCGTLRCIKRLRQHLNDVDDHTYASACQVAALQQRRNNVSATLEVLQARAKCMTDAALGLLWY